MTHAATTPGKWALPRCASCGQFFVEDYDIRTAATRIVCGCDGPAALSAPVADEAPTRAELAATIVDLTERVDALESKQRSAEAQPRGARR